MRSKIVIILIAALSFVGCQSKAKVHGVFLKPVNGNGRYVYRRNINHWDWYYFPLDSGSYPPYTLPSTGTWYRSNVPPQPNEDDEVVGSAEEEFSVDEETGSPEGIEAEGESGEASPSESAPSEGSPSDSGESGGDSGGGDSGGGDGGGGDGGSSD